MCFGTAIGPRWGNNTAWHLAGMLIGLAIGSSIRKEERHEDGRDGVISPVRCGNAAAGEHGARTDSITS